MEKIKVFAPASIANVGCGYDTFGFAVDSIGEELELSKRTDSKLVIAQVEGADLSKDADKNVATIAIKALLSALEIDQGFDISIRKFFKPGSGLGSSASSAAGAVFAVNELLDKPFSKKELIPFALEGEAFASKCYHADNVAPSLLGGFQVIRSYDPLDLFDIKAEIDLQVLVIFPQVQIKTAESKKLLPSKIPISLARDQWGNVAGLIHALYAKDYNLLNRSISDFIAEPVRSGFIPFYDEVKRTVSEAGAVGFNISGSGPSMFALFKSEAEIETAIDGIESLYLDSDFDFSLYRTSIDFQGCRVIA
ncbi:MAG: homoserine kinase [Ekhidna sp.]